MRLRLIAIAVVAACDLQPPPKQAPAPPPPATPAAPATPADASIMAVLADAAPVTDECENIAVHITQVVIDSMKDAVLKANYEHDKPAVVLGFAQACTSQAWSKDAKQCYMDAKAEADVRVCEKKFPPPPKT